MPQMRSPGEAVSRNGRQLQHASDALRGDRDVVLAAVRGAFSCVRKADSSV